MTTILSGLTARKVSALRTRFWRYVHEDGRDHDLPTTACWEWGGATANGNPVASANGQVRPARYVAYALEVEDFEEGYHVVCTCRNRQCVNPAHLKLAVWRPENYAEPELKQAAQSAVSAAVWKNGALPHISTQACANCGAQATAYHHHLGYEPENWLDVTPLCTPCHRRAEWKIIRESRVEYYI